MFDVVLGNYLHWLFSMSSFVGLFVVRLNIQIVKFGHVFGEVQHFLVHFPCLFLLVVCVVNRWVILVEHEGRSLLLFANQSSRRQFVVSVLLVALYYWGEMLVNQTLLQVLLLTQSFSFNLNRRRRLLNRMSLISMLGSALRISWHCPFNHTLR